MIYFPDRVALAGLFVYLLLFFCAPLDLVFPVSIGALAYVGMCYLAFFLGCFLVRRNIRRTGLSKIKRYFGRDAIWIFAFIGTFGMIVRVYDKYISRGGGFGGSAIEAREMIADVSAGPLSALGGVLFPFCYVPLILWWVLRENEKKTIFWQKLVAITVFALPALDALVLLSRSQMLVAFSMMYFAASCVLYKGQMLPRQLLAPVLIGTTVLSLVSMIAFSSRLSEMDVDLAFSILNSAYGYVATPDAWALEAMRDPDSLSGAIVSAGLPLVQYYVHGFFEFGLLWDRSGEQVFTFGVQHFAPYIKALGMLGLAVPDISVLDSYYRVGVFTTFFGPLWLDFAWGGVFLMLIFGAACEFVSRQARGGRLASYPLYAYICVVLFFMPVVNFLVSAQGVYVVSAFIAFWFVFEWRVVERQVRATR